MKKSLLKFLKYFGYLISLLVLFILVLLIIPTPKPLEQKKENDNYIITNVNIIDVLNDSIISNKSIVVENNRITQISPADSILNLSNYKIIDANKKYAMAGLWDMHSHLALQVAPQTVMPLHIANGVTNIRDMQGVVSINKERRLWREQIESGKLLGPRLIGFADEIVGDNYDERDVTKVVNRSAKDKRTFIKIYSNILSERYFELAKQAKNQNVDFAGHYPDAINPIDASNAGQRSFEHAHLFIDYSHSASNKSREYNRSVNLGEEPDEALWVSYEERIANFDYNKFYELVDIMVKNETYFCPTHITKRYESSVHNDEFLNDDRIKYIPYILKNIWKDDINGTKQSDQQLLTDFYKKGLELTGLAHKRGLKILAGTDSYDPYSFPGFSLHSELEQLVKAGLSPAEALATATINPSEYFSLSNDYGTLEKGKVADILLLNENPLIDIKNSTSIDMLFFNGSLYNREELNGFLNYVTQNVSGIKGLSINAKIFFRLMKDNRPSARNNQED
ncbi:MAG: amidohydrolase family protein [Psychroserpens sp.]|uniref:amidohydrolase family protein n=1 Tax=Psychroserpens sp. TaxID=2020870 RepID=UPI0030020D9E